MMQLLRDNITLWTACRCSLCLLKVPLSFGPKQDLGSEWLMLPAANSELATKTARLRPGSCGV